MSKGAFNGLLKGKLGNTIFYKVTNSSDKEKQGQRQYVASIANPRTAPQATQRMRMKPAINFYRGLADLLDHSWEGVKYGALSRQKFMQLALSPTVTGIPYVDKGEARFIPGAYPLSIGSVGADTSIMTIHPFESLDQGSWAQTKSLEFCDDFSSGVTWGEWSTETINLSKGMLRDGDEITFIAVYEQDGFYIPMHTYVVLDKNSSLPSPQVYANAGILIYNEGFCFPQNISVNESGNIDRTLRETNIVAAGVIVSRHPSRTSTTWLRSTSALFCSNSFKDKWMSVDRFAAALATYQNSQTDLTSDWLLNQAENQGSTSGGSGGGGIIQNFTLENRSLQPVSGAAQQRAYYNDGTLEGFVCLNKFYNDIEPPNIVLDSTYEVENNTIVAKAGMSVPVGTKLIDLNEYPSVRTKIAQFYQFM